MLDPEKVRGFIIPLSERCGADPDKTGCHFRILTDKGLSDVTACRLTDQHDPADRLTG
ncbi:hypothetical protein SDC9_138974 [bioreactor metagenome]|uniref:Uncharacterized protein n=1 Tax=bioreactor metagenome TaxID=1076179 RepID=A0A645DQT4_9ZZZZ